jgi:hypothetical protein
MVGGIPTYHERPQSGKTVVFVESSQSDTCIMQYTDLENVTRTATNTAVVASGAATEEVGAAERAYPRSVYRDSDTRGAAPPAAAEYATDADEVYEDDTAAADALAAFAPPAALAARAVPSAEAAAVGNAE